MKIRVMEYSGEIGKIPGYLDYEFEIDLKDFNLERFFKEREKAHKKYLEMKRRIMSNVYEEIAEN